MKARLRNLRAVLARRMRHNITRGGVLFTLAVAGVAAAAVVSANNLLFLILATMISTLLISGLVNRLCLAGLEMDFLVPEHVSAGRTVGAKLYVRNVKGWMPSFSIQVVGVEDQDPSPLVSAVYFPVIPGGATLEETVEVRFARRGAYRQNSFAFSTRFPFGFLEKTERVTLRREVVVYPSVDPQPGFDQLLTELGGEIESHYRGLGRDFYRIRPYQAFESARHVDWKATAHTGSLQVREFAREQELRLEMFLDRDVPPGDEPWFERAVNCCAFLAWHLSARGTSITFRSQDFVLRVPEEGDIYGILKYLALVYPMRGKAPGPPFDDTAYQIVVSLSPERFSRQGWEGARILGRDAFPADRGGAAGGSRAG
jgi:uncharacterized protein (DUF58 family)